MLDPKVVAYGVLFSSPETGHQVGGHTPEAPLLSTRLPFSIAFGVAFCIVFRLPFSPFPSRFWDRFWDAFLARFWGAFFGRFGAAFLFVFVVQFSLACLIARFCFLVCLFSGLLGPHEGWCSRSAPGVAGWVDFSCCTELGAFATAQAELQRGMADA